jgi:hypothetical protein
MLRTFLFIFSLAAMSTLFACGGSSEEIYDGRFTYDGVTYHCTSFEAGDPCQQRRDCSKCDKV